MVKSNKSRTYLLPLIAPLIGIEERFYDLIENTFMFDSENQYKDCFFIIQNFSFKNPEFTAYEHRITNNDLFVKAVDIKDKVIYIYKFPKEYTHEYYEFTNSNYSTFLEDAKKQILKFWTVIKGKQISGASFILKIKQILYKDKKLKEELENRLKVKIADDAELGSLVDLNSETINLNEYN